MNDPQPPPKKSDAPATWDLVVKDLAEMVDDDAVVGTILEEMKERDTIGAKKYGVRHQAFNGRDHLVDAYQEILDCALYLRADMVETLSADLEVTRAYMNALNLVASIRKVVESRRTK